jgi:hypothetical protein
MMSDRADSRIRVQPMALWVLALAALLALTGCQPPEFLQSELPNDGPPIPVSQAAAARFVEKVAAAGEGAVATKRLDLTVTQEEVTSFLGIGSQIAAQMEEMNVTSLQQLEGSAEFQTIEGLPQWLELLQGREGLSDLSLRLGIREPQVYFTGSGQIIIRGYAEVLGQRQPLRLVLAPRASDGEVVMDFVEGKLGPVTVPEALIDQLGLGLAKLLVAGDQFVRVSEIRVSNGALTVRGGYVQ